MTARTYCTETRAEEGEALDHCWRDAAADGEITADELVEIDQCIARNTQNWGDQAGENRYAVAFLAGGFPALESYHSQVNKIRRSIGQATGVLVIRGETL